MVPRGVMVAEFENVAFSLADGELSPVFKSDYGYHIMQMIERRGEQFNARHILIKPNVSSTALGETKSIMDSLISAIRAEEITFSQAAADNSEDESSSSTDGLVIDPQSSSSKWDIGALDAQTFFVIDKLELGEVSEPSLITAPDGSQQYRILKLIERSEPHRADLSTDYRLFRNAAMDEARGKAIDDWLRIRLSSTYVRLADELKNCEFDNQWGAVSSN